MYTKWTSHLTDPDDKARFQNSVLGSKPVLKRLTQLIDEDVSKLEKVETNVAAFDLPNWEYRQAFYNGSKAAYNALKKLIDLDQQKQETLNERHVI